MRANRAHGYVYLRVLHGEAAWLGRGIRALGYVSGPRDARRLGGRGSGVAAALDRLPARLRGRIAQRLGDAPHRRIVVAL
ncbi:hypothetical protein AAHH80_32725, partial [Burkholderia pseudomallei]